MAMVPPREIMLKSSHLAFLGLFVIVYVSKREEVAQLSMESCLQHWHCIKSWLLSLVNYEKGRDWAAKALAPDSFKSGSNCSSLRQQCCVVNLHHSLCPTDTLPVWHTGSYANIPLLTRSSWCWDRDLSHTQYIARESINYQWVLTSLILGHFLNRVLGSS